MSYQLCLLSLSMGQHDSTNASLYSSRIVRSTFARSPSSTSEVCGSFSGAFEPPSSFHRDRTASFWKIFVTVSDVLCMFYSRVP